MDVIAIGFYAVICGLLGLFSPLIGRPFLRVGIGAIVGVVAASLLPLLRAITGVY